MTTKKNKKNLAFLFTSQLYVRNFIENKTIDNLIKDKNNLFIIQNCKIPDSFKGRYIKIKELSFRKKFSYSIAEKLKTRKNKDKSKSFYTRIIRERTYFLRMIRNPINLFKKRNLIIYMQYLIPLILEKICLGETIINLLLKNKDNSELTKIIKENNIDILVIPSGGVEAEMHYSLESCKRCLTKSILIIDNWDNLSSKSVLINKPNKVLVWGDQMANDAENIHGINKKNIYKVGCSRFETYYTESNYKKILDNPYILFVGMASQFNEIKILKIIDDAISLNKEFFQDTKLLYRPHPWQKNLGIINEKDFKNLFLDPQIKEYYNKGVWNIDFQPSLKYYPSLIKGADLVIGGASTFLLEATIMKTKYIILAIKEKSHESINDSYSILHSYTHLDGITNNKILEFCYEYSDIYKIIRKTKNKVYPINERKEFLEFYIGNNNRERYEERLYKSIFDKY